MLNEHFLHSGIDLANVVIVSPDEGSIKRALGHAKRIGGTVAIIDKRRMSAETTVQAHILGGQVEGKVALMFDDMISTAGSISGAAKTLHEHGVKGNSRRRHARRALRPGDRTAHSGQPR